MKTIKNLFKMYVNYKSKKSRFRSVKLALQTNSDSHKIVDLAKEIDKYINNGL